MARSFIEVYLDQQSHVRRLLKPQRGYFESTNGERSMKYITCSPPCELCMELFAAMNSAGFNHTFAVEPFELP